MNGQPRANIKPGMTVLIVLKQDQRTGKLTKGVVSPALHTTPTRQRTGVRSTCRDGNHPTAQPNHVDGRVTIDVCPIPGQPNNPSERRDNIPLAGCADILQGLSV